MSNFAIACKLPNGVQLEHKGEKVTLAGSNSPNARFGYGITYDVDPDWFKDWVDEVGNGFPPYATGAIFAFDGDDNGELAEKEDDATLRTGQEPLDPDAPAPGIEPTDEMKKELAKAANAKDKAKATAGKK